MNDHPKPSQEQVKASLNLQKFAGAEGDPETAAGEGQTMFIKKAAAQAVGQDPATANQGSEQFGLPLEEMLGVIAYCYVRGVFSSKEIAEKLQHEPQLRKKFGKQLPEEEDIKAFRRHYAADIEDLLETVYQAFPPQAPTNPAKPGASQADIAHREAVERLHDASWEDNMRRHLH